MKLKTILSQTVLFNGKRRVYKKIKDKLITILKKINKKGTRYFSYNVLT